MAAENRLETESEHSASAPLAVVQFAPHTDPAANLQSLTEHVRAAARDGAKIIVAPEYSMFSVARLDERVWAVAETLTGPFVRALADLARECGVYLVAGVVEIGGGGDERIHNTVVVLDPQGVRVTQYRKAHLYDAFGHRESDIVRPGPIDALPLFTAYGLTFGLQTCFDLRFPEGFRRLATAGAQVLLLPAQWIPGPGKINQWTTLLRARAIENTVYLAAADQCAPRGGGFSMIIDPTGRILAQLADEPAIAIAEIDPQYLAKTRAINPALTLNRFAIAPHLPG